MTQQEQVGQHSPSSTMSVPASQGGGGSHSSGRSESGTRLLVMDRLASAGRRTGQSHFAPAQAEVDLPTLLVKAGAMRVLKHLAFVPLLVSVACAPAVEPAPPAPPPPPPQSPPVTQAPVESAAPEPTPEEKAQAEAAAKLAAETEAMEASAKVEAERWTPEMHSKAKKLSETAYPSVRAAYAQLKTSTHRVPGNAERDKYRHPAETLEFFGLKPNMTVFEYGPGEGWYTELLAPMLAPKGKLIVNNSDPNGPPTERATMYGKRLDLFLKKAPELYGSIEVLTVDTKNPNLNLEGTLDMALVIRGMHGWKRNGVVGPWLQQIYKALKPGGVLGIVQHRGMPDADPAESAEHGYLPEPWVIEQVKAAGFKLSKKSELNKNDKDTKDYPEGVWSLPPTLRLGDTDRAKYEAIGESDRMTLRFVK